MAMINRCPHCGNTDIKCRKKHAGLVFWIFVLISMGLALIMYPFLPVECVCKKCGTRWRP